MTQLQRCKSWVLIGCPELQMVKHRRRRQERHRQNHAIERDSLPRVPMPYIS